MWRGEFSINDSVCGAGASQVKSSASRYGVTQSGSALPIAVQSGRALSRCSMLTEGTPPDYEIPVVRLLDYENAVGNYDAP